MVWTRRPASRTATPSSGRTPAPQIAAALERDGRGDLIRERRGCRRPPTSPAASSQWMLDNVDGVREPPNGRGPVRHHRQLAAVEPDRRCRRRPAHHRRDQRQPDHVDGPGDARVGRRSCSTSSASRGRCCRRSCPPRTRRVRTHPRRWAVGGEVTIGRTLGDQQAAMVGQVCLTAGEAKNTYGTGNFLLLDTGDELVRSDNGLLTTVCYRFGYEPPVYALGGSIAVTGSAVQWLRDQLKIISRRRGVEALAARSTTPAGPTSCRRSPGCSRRTGARTPAARSSGCRASTRGPPGPGDAGGDLHESRTWWRRWRPIPACTSTC